MSEFTVTVQEAVGGEAVTYFCDERPRFVAKYIEGDDGEGDGFTMKGVRVRDVSMRGVEFIPTNGPEWRRGAAELRVRVSRPSRHRAVGDPSQAGVGRRLRFACLRWQDQRAELRPRRGDRPLARLAGRPRLAHDANAPRPARVPVRRR